MKQRLLVCYMINRGCCLLKYDSYGEINGEETRYDTYKEINRDETNYDAYEVLLFFFVSFAYHFSDFM